ncbi:hypothetical protein GCM10023196_055670 [Actinoallomurus vinaceus]|uniref:Uncharacterized protein n=1 Tax=Actinoallomurus vinaceus TaxID=1080074 RepID=A0ABP8UI24_9ACTN
MTRFDGLPEFVAARQQALMRTAYLLTGDGDLAEDLRRGPDPMAIPYRPQPQGFAVYRPKFLEVPGRYESDQSGLAESFFAGVDSHEQAAAVWDAHLIDQSV